MQAVTIEEFKAENILLKNAVSSLKEQLDWFKRQVFGKRSEKIVADLDEKQLYLEGLAPVEEPPVEKQDIPAHTRRKNKKGKDEITLPPDLPVETQIIDLPESKKICPKTGKPLVKIGEEISYKLALHPGSFFLKEIIRPKYALPNGEGIKTAELPDSIIPRCRADESLLADILVKKYADHLPLYRIQEILSRQRIGISRQLLSQWVVRIGTSLEILVEEMKKRILDGDTLYIDEIPVPLLAKKQTTQAYMWTIVGGENSQDPPYRVYNFRKNRQHLHAKELLAGYKGHVHSDKYGAYESLAQKKEFVWCPCYSHIRRKFFEAEAGDPKFREWILRKIRYLFMFERVAWARSAEERLTIRQEKEIPLIDEIIAAVKERLHGKYLPKSKFRQALGYISSLIPYLKNYTTHPYARLDNNVAERAVRPLAIGRKNWLFLGSERGGEAAANILSLVQTCRGLGINPHTYLEDVLRRLMSHSASKVYELLPDEWMKRKKIDRSHD